MPVRQAALCIASYDFPMESSELQQKVFQALSLPGYGATAEEVLTTCCLVAQAEINLSNAELSAIQSEVNVSHQIWKRMVSVSANLPLWEKRSVMPANFSALYRLSLLKPAVLRQGVDDGTINPKITTREIESLKKSKEIQSRFKTSNHSIFLFCKKELDGAKFAELLSRINVIASEYDACFDTQDLIEIQKENNRRLFDIRRQSIESHLRDEISLVTSPAATLDGVFLSDDDRKKLDQLPINLSFGDFVKTVKTVSRNREEMMRYYGRMYCLKLAQEYWKTDSRTQRYNCKKRLKEVEASYPIHARYSRWVLDTLVRMEDDDNTTEGPNQTLAVIFDNE
jgi:hypothetical protein